MSFEAWFGQAEDDLNASKVLLAGGHPSQAIWLATQASEKAHKALLFALGLKITDDTFKKGFGHKVGVLVASLPDELQAPVDTAMARAVSALDNVQDQCRYPALRGGVLVSPYQHVAFGKSQAKDFVEQAASLLAWCEDRARRARVAVDAMKP